MTRLSLSRQAGILLLALLHAAPSAFAEPLAYVPIAAAAHVQVIDTRNGNTVKMIPVASGPIGVAVDAARARVYVAHQGGNRLTVISTATRAVVGTLELPTDAWGVVVSGDGSRAYVALSGQNRVGVVDTATLTLVDSVDTGDTPRNLALSPDGGRLYVSNQSASTLTVIDTSTLNAIGSYPLTTAALGIALHPSGNPLYAVGAFGGEMVRFDTLGNAVVGSTPTGNGPSGVAVNSDASRLYVAATGGDTVTVIDGATYQAITSIAVGDGPYGIAVSADDSRVYVVNVHGESMSVIDTASNTVVATYPLLDGAFAVGGFLAPATVPDAPTIDAATPADGQASISFSAPAFDGGADIDQYHLRCNPGALSFSGPASPLVATALTNNSVYRCTVTAENALGEGAASAEISVIPGANGTTTDLSISKTNSVSFVNGGGRIGYLIDVVNHGPAAVAGARVVDALENYFSAAQWLCAGSNGGQCPASGSGDLDVAVDLPIGASVQFQLSALLAPLPEDPVSNVAAVAVPASINDTDLANNTAADGPDVRGVFRDGFE
jgi:YVTN family beta-propeller protein